MEIKSSLIEGFNHLTLAVSDVDKSVNFYEDLLNAQLKARWESGAYLELGGLWVCLSLDNNTLNLEERGSYTHYAFTVSPENFPIIVKRLRTARVTEFKKNRSEGDSFYFLDPDGHKLELHVGNLQSRLESLKNDPYESLALFE